jgi:hypothetical protein
VSEGPTAEQLEFEQLTLLDEEANREWCAWLAGILDAEGWIGMRMRWRKGMAPTAAVAVKMCEPAVVRALHDRYAGRFALNARVERQRPTYEWVVAGRGCVGPLRDALSSPFLLIKREQAVVVLEAARLTCPHGVSASDLDRAARVRAYHRCRELNRRGVSA